VTDSPVLHRRSVSVETASVQHEGDQALLLRGRLTDERPAIGAVRVIHDVHLLQGRAAFTSAHNEKAGAQNFLPASALLALRGTCRVWAPSGVGEQKVAAGWRPSSTEYPAPPPAEARSRDEP